MLQSHNATRRQPGPDTMLMLILMLMLCLGKSGCDRRHIVEAALAIRDVTLREGEPSFEIRDTIEEEEERLFGKINVHYA